MHSFVVYHRAFSENETPPYNVALIALEEGARIVSTVENGNNVKVGDLVKAMRGISTYSQFEELLDERGITVGRP